MEKRKPHCDLKKLKKLFSSEATRVITATAQKGAADLGYMDEDAIVEVINKLCAQHFDKSMTSYHNSQIWQDVYKFKDEEKNIYIKLQLSVNKTQTVLIQMKRDEGGD
ncbi:MAG: type II toxin-antitoxin system MqsR family toxin [Nitrospirota bacterium]